MYSTANYTYILDLQLLTVVCIQHLYLLLNLLGFSSLALWKSKHRSASIPIPKQLFITKICVLSSFVDPAAIRRKRHYHTSVCTTNIPAKHFSFYGGKHSTCPLQPHFRMSPLTVLTKSEWKEVSQVIQLSTEYQIYQSSLMQAQFLLHHTCSVNTIHATGSICCQE